MSPSTTYRYQVRAVDASGNLSGYSNAAEATTAVAPPTPPGLVGAWAFDEGAGTTTADASGSGNAGTLIGASWTTQGRYGNALSFNGSNSMVRVADSASLDLTTAMTLSAWIRPTVSQSGWRTILQRETDAYFLNASNSDGPLRPSGGGTFGGNTQYLSGPTASPVNAWTHVALTYDGATLRLFVNGTQVATRATTGAIQATDNPLWIGGNNPYGEYFEGLIDEVRVYNRALTQADIQADMSTGIVPAASRHDAAVGADGADRDGRGLRSGRPELDRLDRQRRRQRLPRRALPGSGLHQLRPGRDADGDHLQRHRPASPSTTYRYQVRAVDAAGNLSGYSSIATATTPAAADTTAPSAPTGLTATRAGPTRIDLSWTASTDNVGVTGYRVERCQGAGCTNFAQVGDADRRPPSATPAWPPSTTYRYQVRAVDAAGNLSAYSSIATATTPAAADTTAPSAPTGLSATAISTTRIDLSWTASTDNVGVTGYRVERCQGASCTNFAEVGTPTATSFSDTGLAASTTYRYRVRAVDAAGNLEPLLRDRHGDDARRSRHDGAVGAHRALGAPRSARPGSTWPGPPRPTTSASAATASSAARARTAPTSPRWGRRRPPTSATRDCRRTPTTASACGRSTPPATSAPTPPS